MKQFRDFRGNLYGETMTVAELKASLSGYPDDMPVLIEWESVHAFVKRENFSIERSHKGHGGDDCDCLVLDANDY